MYQLVVKVNDESAVLDVDYDSIKAFKDTLPHPIEIEAFGPQIMMSMLGKANHISLELKDEKGNVIDSEAYDLKLA